MCVWAIYSTHSYYSIIQGGIHSTQTSWLCRYYSWVASIWRNTVLRSFEKHTSIPVDKVRTFQRTWWAYTDTICKCLSCNCTKPQEIRLLPRSTSQDSHHRTPYTLIIAWTWNLLTHHAALFQGTSVHLDSVNDTYLKFKWHLSLEWKHFYQLSSYYYQNN